MKTYLLDCTLRDGGYVNNWMFGRAGMVGIQKGLEKAKVDIIELGFFRNELSDPDRTVFSDANDIKNKFDQKSGSALYSAMIEGNEPSRNYPADLLGSPSESGIDLIRVCTWKRLKKEHFDYCRAIADKGYFVSIQPTAVEQYDRNEFIELLKNANEIHPYSFYVVDTWGTQSSDQICDYLSLADAYLDHEIKIGYHGHNNKMQALSCAQAALNMNLCHDLCIDGSIMGMGRGVGNLQIEVIMEYLNHRYGQQYDPMSIIDLYDRYIKNFYIERPWGYSLYHYLSALYHSPQDFASYFKEQDLGEKFFELFLKSLTAEEKIVFRESFVKERILELQNAATN